MGGAIYVLIIVAMFCIFGAVGMAFYDYKVGAMTLAGENVKQDWLFNGFQTTLYDLVYPHEKSDTICGINKKDYERYCRITHTENKFKSIVALRLEAVFILFGGLILAYALSSMLWSAVIVVAVACTAAALMWILPYNNIKDKAEERLFRIQDDLPRFLSLMEKAMDLPIDQALLVTAQKFESPLSEDIIDSINKVTLGANGWQSTLFDLAKVYNISDFSDLVLDIINSYEQGTNIRVMVTRKTFEIEQNRMYAVEAHDSKTKTLIFLPIILLKILPLMVMIVLPMISFYL